MGRRHASRASRSTQRQEARTRAGGDGSSTAVERVLVLQRTAGDLADVEQRQRVVFNTDPRTNIPGYNQAPPGINLAGNVLTKTTGPMTGAGATDHHSGAGHATAFQYGPQQNLRKAAWSLVGMQFYEYRQLPAGPWVKLHQQPYTIHPQMAQDASGQWKLRIRKYGPGVDVTAGPTPIYDMVSHLAMGDIAQSRQDQTAEWQAELGTITGLGLGMKTLKTETLKLPKAAKTRASVRYETTVPVAAPAANQPQFYQPSEADLQRVLKEARTGMALVKTVMDGPNPPTRIVFTLAFNTGNVRQQAWWTNENGGTYRVLLRADKILSLRDHILGSVPGQAADAAKAGKKKDKDKTREAVRCYARGSAVHEMGHMLHAKASPDKFLSSNLLAPLAPPQGGVVDPIRTQKEQMATINSQIMAKLGQQNYPGRWAYAITNGNPSEVVAEVFTALLQDPLRQVDQTIPAGLAAVYLVYGGHRSAEIDKKLARIFPGGIPAITRPQDALSLI